MSKLVSIKDYEVFSDFDGTIIIKDSTDELIKTYGNELTIKEEEMFWARLEAEGKANNRETIVRLYEHMRLTPQMYYELLHSIPLDLGFARFYDAVKAAGKGITVLTGSASEGVLHYLREKGFADITVHGNRMGTPEGFIEIYCADAPEDTLCGEGDCAHCKSVWLKRANESGKKTLYIGDGVTDLCAARLADLVFAKDYLAAHCEKNGIPFVRYDSFDDICGYLFNPQSYQA